MTSAHRGVIGTHRIAPYSGPRMLPSSSVGRFAQVSALAPAMQRKQVSDRARATRTVMSGETFVLMANAGSQNGFFISHIAARAKRMRRGIATTTTPPCLNAQAFRGADDCRHSTMTRKSCIVCLSAIERHLAATRRRFARVSRPTCWPRMMAAAVHERRLDCVSDVVVIAPRQNNIAHLRRPWRANVNLAWWVGTGASTAPMPRPNDRAR